MCVIIIKRGEEMILTINIENKTLQKQISQYLSDKNQETNEFMLQLIKQFFQKENKPLLSKEEIAKVVENSQRIEGYEPVSDEVTNRVKHLMKKHNVQVSF